MLGGVKVFFGMDGLARISLNDNHLIELDGGIFADVAATLTVINLSGNKLSELAATLFSGMISLQTLKLGNNDLTELDGGIFAEVAATLTYLTLNGNKLSDLNPTLFSGMTSLQTLKLGNNELTELDGGIFTDMAATLTYLSLSGNKLGELNPTPLSGMISLQTLYLSDNDFTELDGGIFADVAATLTVFYLGGNKLSELTATLFSGMTSLQTVDISDNDFTDLDGGTFAEVAATLTELSLAGNKFSELNAMLFSGMTSLHELDLNDNDFTELDGGTFADAAATLTVLALGGNKLSDLNPTLFSGMTSLQTLKLYDNDFTKLDGGTFAEVAATLTYLNLAGNKLSELDAMLFSRMTSLQTLDLSDNDFTELDGGIFADVAATLTELYLAGNKFNELNAMFFSRMISLQTLKLSDNDLTKFDGGIFADVAATLTDLSLYGNKFSELNATLFSGMTLLQTLYLENNDLTELDGGIFADVAATLTELYLAGNKLSDLNPTLFSGMTLLQTLILDNNDLTELYGGIFADVAATLTELSLYGNKLSELNTTLFSGMTSLKSLYLRDNHFTELNATLFTNTTTNLEYLDLSKNQLTMVDQATFAPLAATLTSLYLAENNMKRVDAVLNVLQQSVLTSLTMEGNPSQCWIAADTYQNPGSSIVCSCAPDFDYIQHNQFVLRGPEAQLALAEDQQVDNIQFHWNGYFIDENDVTVNFQWKEEDKSTATIDWTCNVPNCKAGGFYDIVNQTGRTKSSGIDAPGEPVQINYNVIATPSSSITTTAASGNPQPQQTTTTTIERRSASVRMVYSAFHLPYQFQNASQTIVEIIAGKGLQSARVLRIKENTSATASSPTATIDWLETLSHNMPAFVETNSRIPTSITFRLIDTDNTCNDMNNVSNPLSVRQVYDPSNRDLVVGWEVVVGDPLEMANIENGTMRPCTALLQATDSVTGENLTVTNISASVKNCFESNSSSVDPKALSCNGHGKCNKDADPYDGIFKGCDCISGWEGERCDVEACDRSKKKAYNRMTKTCGVFKLVKNDTRRSGRSSNNYKRPENYPVTPPEMPIYKVTVGTSFHISPLEINRKTTVSTGTVDSITYALSNNAPDGFYVSSKTGEIFGEFYVYDDSQKSINITLNAVDLNGLSLPLEIMIFTIKPKPPDATPIVVACTAFTVVLGIIIHKLRQQYLGKKDAAAALARARKVYGLVDPGATPSHGICVNSGDLVGVTTNAAFIGLDADDSDDVVLLLDAAVGYKNDLLTYEDDDDGTTSTNALASCATDAAQTQLSKFVAPTMSLGKSTLAAKGLDVLLGVDPKTYMHVKNKVKVMLKEFAKNGTDEDINNLKTLIEGTYKHPPNGDETPPPPPPPPPAPTCYNLTTSDPRRPP
eukprot:gene13468-24677_t